jgi:hypothetical protein
LTKEKQFQKMSFQAQDSTICSHEKLYKATYPYCTMHSQVQPLSERTSDEVATWVGEISVKKMSLVGKSKLRTRIRRERTSDEEEWAGHEDNSVTKANPCRWGAVLQWNRAAATEQDRVDPAAHRRCQQKKKQNAGALDPAKSKEEEQTTHMRSKNRFFHYNPDKISTSKHRGHHTPSLIWLLKTEFSSWLTLLNLRKAKWI